MKKSNHKNKNHTRAWRSFAALLVVALAAIFLTSDFISSEASNRFPGVDTIISNVSENNSSYTILELEPDSGLGQIGYYVKGGEYNYLTDLIEAKLSGQTMTSDSLSRSNAFSAVKSMLITEGICAPDNASDASAYPISGGLYSEKFFLDTTDTASDWHRLTLPNAVYFDYAGSFTTSTGRTGDYDVVANSVVGFEAATAPVGAYDVTFATGVSDSNSDDYKNAALYGAYTLQADGSYLKVANTYVDSSFYYVHSFNASTTNTGAYNPLHSYTFNLNGTGAYDFSKDDARSMNKVSVQKVYYQAGFTNNELLKKDVFGITDDTEYSNFKINVTTLTENEISTNNLAAENIPEFDMLYVSGDSTGSGKTYASVKVASGKSDADYMDYDRLQSLLTKIFETSENGSRSCVIDYSIFDKISKESTSGSYVYKLCAALLQNDVKNAYENNIMGKTESSVDWSALLSSAQSNGNLTNHNYAKDNVYCWYNTSSISGASADTNRNLVTKDLSTAYTDSTLISNGFQPVLDLIDTENTIRSYTDPLSKTISQARAIQYIINSWNPRKTDIKSEFNILEVEPSASYDLTTDIVESWAADLIKQNPTIKINITQMTSSEFIGKINDLNTSYDMIYFGVNAGKMNVDKTTKRTVYNDINMNGLVYTHNGDYVYCEDEIAGILNRDYVGGNTSNYLYAESFFGKSTTTYSYDRTETLDPFKVTINSKNVNLYNAANNKKLESVKTQDVGVYRYSGNDINSFKLNDLIDYVKGRYAVVVDSRVYNISTGQIQGVDDSYIDNSSNMYTFLNTVKNYDNIITYDATAKSLSSQAKFESYLNMNKPSFSLFEDQSNGKSLSYVFSISSNVETDANTRYALSFYADINADGQYSSQEEIMDGVVTTAAGTEVPKDSNGRYLLRKNVTYVFNKSLGDNFAGYIPYKVQISNSNPEYASIRTAVTGHTIITGTVKQDVYILQINQSTASGSTGSTFNMANQQSDTNSTFRRLLNDVTDYNIHITTLSSNDYVTNFNNAAKDGKNYLDNYNMIVMGFADVYQDITNVVDSQATLKLSPLGGVLKFIKDGKSVLFTHDTTSFVNVSSRDKLNNTNGPNGIIDASNSNWAYWGYNINSVLRSVVGMDRFGVTGSSKSILDIGDVLYFGDGIAQAGTTAVDKNSLSANDFSYVANSKQEYASGEVQGFTNNLLNSKKLDASAYFSVLNSLPEIHNENGAYSSQMWATQINTGQITQYPFAISTDIKLAPTHFQYYQLDMDADDNGDGKSDIVVWYTISKVSGSNSNIYTNSPNDVRNNYYIYSKGNVMYSGVGHSSVASSEDELKLYINTIIAAYKNGAQAPVPTIRDNSSITSSKKSNEYITYDDAIAAASGSLDKDLTLYYSVEDPNLIAGD